MTALSLNLSDQFRTFVSNRSPEARISCQESDRDSARCISRLAARGVTTLPLLIVAAPDLPPRLKQFALWWLQVTAPASAEPMLLRLLHSDPENRVYCASILGKIGGKRSLREFVRIGRTQLASAMPDAKWLHAVLHGLKMGGSTAAAEILVSIYERIDLPGWLRGDAGDGLSCVREIHDRRTKIFRRVLAAALRGINEPGIEVQFWSMYVIMQLATRYKPAATLDNQCLYPALPRLREIARDDHRMAPGYWWPMSAEAEDAIECIETGTIHGEDAGERWLGNPERGGCAPRD